MSNIRVESLQGIKLRGCCFAEITNMFSKDSLQSIKTPSRLTEVYNDFWGWFVFQVSCSVFVKMMALNLSWFTVIELVWNQSIAKFDFNVNEFISSGIV